MAVDDLQRVNPGDLITASFVNGLVDALAALEVRVEELENAPAAPPAPAPGAPVLERRQPTGEVTVGTLLTLIGQNFSPLSQARVRFGGEEITSFALGSSSTRLAFQVPQLTGLPRTVSVTASTPQGTSNALSVPVAERPPVQGGEVFVDDLTGELGTIEAGQTYTLRWRVRSETLLPVTYDFSIALSAVDPPESLPGWQGAITLNSEQEQIGAASPFEVVATVTVPAGAGTATIALRAESTDGQFGQTSAPVTLTVGEETELSDPRVQLVPIEPTPLDPETGDPNPVRRVAGVYEVAFGATGIVQVEIQLQPEEEQGGRYEFRSSLEDDGGGRWVAAAIAPAEILLDPGEETTVNFGLQNAGSPSSPPPATFFVVRAAKRNTADTADEYVSFTRIPIRARTGA